MTFARTWSERWPQQHGLPGLRAHKTAAPPTRALQLDRVPHPDQAQKHAAVLVLLYPQDRMLHTLLIERPSYEGVHSGQMAFPGGGREPRDADWTDTALREAQEEIGLPTHRPLVIGPLTPLFIPPSGYFVQPILAALDEPWLWQPDPHEVHRVHPVALNRFYRSERNLPQAGQVPAWEGAPQPVWGASAMILAELLALPELRTFGNQFILD